MLTLEQLEQAQKVVKEVITYIFDNEVEFKNTMLGTPYVDSWENFEIKLCHMAGSSFRLTLQHTTGFEKDFYVNVTDVFHWYYEEINK